jgi:hypothetical protein
MVRAGDPIQRAGNVVNGIKLLWRGMVISATVCLRLPKGAMILHNPVSLT